MSQEDSDIQINGESLEWRTSLHTTSSDSPTFWLLVGSEWSQWFLRKSKSKGEEENSIPNLLGRRSKDLDTYLKTMIFPSSRLTVTLIPKKKSKGPGAHLKTPLCVWTFLWDPEDPSEGPTAWKLTKIVRCMEQDIWGPRSTPFDTEGRKLDELWKRRKVKIVCFFSGAHPSLNGESENPHVKKVGDSIEALWDTESLSSDFSRLLEEEIHPDARLECGGRTFRVHRSVLSARSDVFRTMFQNGMLESETGTVRIEDMDAEGLEGLLKFLYTGKAEGLSEAKVADLYEAADKYAIHSLKTVLTAFWIAKNLTAENCVKYLAMADSHSDRDLKAAVIAFIVDNPSVLKGEAWLSFAEEHSKLANEVFQAYVASTVQ